MNRIALAKRPPRSLEVCPPALLRGGIRDWLLGLRAWLATGWAHPSSVEWPRQGRNSRSPHVGQSQLPSVRLEFGDTLDDIRTQQAGDLQARIRVARSLRELWHLRPEVFRLVALRFDQAEALSRLERLNRHFPTRAPRSGFSPLELPSADARPAQRRR